MLSFLEAARYVQLTTVDRVKTDLGISGSAEDARLLEYILDASSAIEEYCRRPFAREVLTEQLPGNDRTLLMLARTPVLRLIEVRYQTAVVDASQFGIFNAGSGMVQRTRGWTASRPISPWLTMDFSIEEPGDVDWALDYVAGYLLPGETYVSNGITASAATKTFTAPGTLPIMVPGDRFKVTGGTNNGVTFTVVSRTALTVQVSETVLEQVTGTEITLTPVETLPRMISSACTDAVKERYLNKDRNTAVKSETIGDYEVEHVVDEASTPDLLSARVRGALRSWVREV